MIRKIFLVVGARPNYMKAAPLIEALSAYPDIQALLIHTGQHYDDVMSKVFFEDLDLPDPDVFLGIGSGTHAEQTAKTMILFEELLEKDKPNLVVVFGDVNSTISAALAAAKLPIPVAHVEAGLRSFDRTMPEEINRLLTDHISDYLFTTSKYDNANLYKEGISSKKIHMVGNIMIDTLAKYLNKAIKAPVLENLGLREDNHIKPYALLTLHRPSNVDDPPVFKGILDALNQVSEKIPVIFPAHPRTRERIQEFGFLDSVTFLTENERFSSPASGTVSIVPPQGYLNFLALTVHARMVLTDSGGIQAETTHLGIPCLTLRESTEWIITLEQGTNSLVGIDPNRIISEAFCVLDAEPPVRQSPEFWDGHTGERIMRTLAQI